MGNCCNNHTKYNNLSHIKTEDEYLKCILQHLSRVQNKIDLFSEKNKTSYQLANMKHNNDDDWNEKYVSYEKEQFYITFGNVLLQMKMIMEEYYMVKNYKSAEDGNGKDGNNSQFNFESKNFNADTAVSFMQELLECEEEKGDKSKLNFTREEIANKIFS